MTEPKKDLVVPPAPPPDPDPPVKEKKKEEVKVEKTEKEEVLEKVQAIVAEHGGMESNIPTNSEYWSLLNRYRSL